MQHHDEYLFVYGTLCKSALNSKHHYLLPEARFVDTAYLNAKLFLIEHYPAVIDSENASDIVRGELYKISEPATLFLRVDDYEACSDDYPEPREYKRVKRQVTTESGDKISAWIYLFNLPTEPFLQIHSGDFVQFQKKN